MIPEVLLGVLHVIELDVRAQHTTTYMHATTLGPEFYCYKNMTFSKLLSLVPRPFISPMGQGMRLKTTLLNIACSKNKKKQNKKKAKSFSHH